MVTTEVKVALFGWIPLCCVFFLIFRPVRALTLAYLLGWLLLPVGEVQVKSFWDVDKILATNIGVMIGTCLFCPSRLKGLRFTLADALLIAFALGTCVTSIVNGLGVYDGVSSVARQIFYFGIPYWLGRSFIRDRRDLLEAGRLVVTASAAYAVLALFEWRMSPKIHRTLYGYFQHSFHQHMRWGFYRPAVCFKHALALGTFFAWTGVLTIWMWRKRVLRPLMGVPVKVYGVLPFLGLAASMSFGPWGMFIVGYGMLSRWSRRYWRLVAIVPAVCALCWIAGRYSGYTDGEWLTDTVAEVSKDRAKSLQGRVDAEDLLIDHAREQPVFGWGTWGRNRVTDDQGRDLAVTDGLWIIFVGCYGVFGLAAFYLWWYWPLLKSRGRMRSIEDEPIMLPILVAIGLQAVNFVFNSFLSPVLTMMAGGVYGQLLLARRTAHAAGRAKRSPSRAVPRLAGPLADELSG